MGPAPVIRTPATSSEGQGRCQDCWCKETIGTQEYEVQADTFLKRLAESYGDEAAAEVRPHL